MRIWVRFSPRMGTSQPWGTGSPSRDDSTCVFKARRRKPGRHPPAALLGNRVPVPFLSASGFQGLGALNRKENSFPDLRRYPQAFFLCRVPDNSHTTKNSGVGLLGLSYGILTVFPFASELPTGNYRNSVQVLTEYPGHQTDSNVHAPAAHAFPSLDSAIWR